MRSFIEEKQNKDIVKEKVKTELKLMEGRYKRQQNKITSKEADTANHILENTSEDIGESFKFLETLILQQ